MCLSKWESYSSPCYIWKCLSYSSMCCFWMCLSYSSTYAASGRECPTAACAAFLRLDMFVIFQPVMLWTCLSYISLCCLWAYLSYNSLSYLWTWLTYTSLSCILRITFTESCAVPNMHVLEQPLMSLDVLQQHELPLAVSVLLQPLLAVNSCFCSTADVGHLRGRRPGTSETVVERHVEGQHRLP
jgi:hypothetical protein